MLIAFNSWNGAEIYRSRRRIARGAGVQPVDVARLLLQFDQLNGMMKRARDSMPKRPKERDNGL